MNFRVYLLMVSGVSQRRVAKVLGIHRKTVVRKFRFLALWARFQNLKMRRAHGKIHELQFDDMETFEHTKLKPLSITLAVEKDSRFIVGFEVSKMPSKGLLAKRALKKYGKRIDERGNARKRLFRKIQNIVFEQALIESDENPHYPKDVKMHWPRAIHRQTKGIRGCVTGQGELKATSFDPLFSLNHTCAMFRANLNRLFRRTWCTTKRIHGLCDHLELYVHFHNHYLLRA